MAKKTGRPFWFKIDMSVKPLFDAIPDENAGRAIKAALEYFETRELDLLSLEPLTLAAFMAVKGFVDDSYSEYEQRIENGKKGGRPPKSEKSNTNLLVSNTNHEVIEEEKEEEKEKEIKKDISFQEVEEDAPSAPFDSFFRKSDSLDIRKERCASVGVGIVHLSDADVEELYKKLSLADFEYYVGVIRNCVEKGMKYKRRTHCQAILDMAAKDGKLLRDVSRGGSFDTDEFFEAAVRKSYEK